jgi:hypothetical protein
MLTVGMCEEVKRCNVIESQQLLQFWFALKSNNTEESC